MFGIIVSEGIVKELTSGLKKITKRGPDSMKVVEWNNNLFMFKENC